MGGCHGEHISWLPWLGGDIAVAVEVAVAEPEAFLAFLTTGFDGEGEGDNSLSKGVSARSGEPGIGGDQPEAMSDLFLAT